MTDLDALLQSLPPPEPFDPATCTHPCVDGMLNEDGFHAGWICRDCYVPFVPQSALARAEAENAALRDAVAEVLRISDRKHDAWDKVKALLAKGAA